MPVGRRRHPGSAAGGESEGWFCLGDDSWLGGTSCAERPHRYGTSTRERQNSGWQPFFFVLFLLLFLGLHCSANDQRTRVAAGYSMLYARHLHESPDRTARHHHPSRRATRACGSRGKGRRGAAPSDEVRVPPVPKQHMDKKKKRGCSTDTQNRHQDGQETHSPTSRTGKVASRDACSKTGAHPTDHRRQLKQPATGGTEQGVTEQIDAPFAHHPREARALGGTATVDGAPKLLYENAHETPRGDASRGGIAATPTGGSANTRGATRRSRRSRTTKRRRPLSTPVSTRENGPQQGVVAKTGGIPATVRGARKRRTTGTLQPSPINLPPPPSDTRPDPAEQYSTRDQHCFSRGSHTWGSVAAGHTSSSSSSAGHSPATANLLGTTAAPAAPEKLHTDASLSSSLRSSAGPPGAHMALAGAEDDGRTAARPSR